MTRRLALHAGLITVAASLAAAPATQPALAPADQVQYQQRTVEAQVGELQDRMFHLADLTRSAEPDDSARLLMAVRKAREDLILEQVRDVIDRLGRGDFAAAADGQQQVLVKLETLKKLLTSTDLDLQMQLDRLRQLNAAIAQLDAATREQRHQQQRTGDLAAKKLDAPAAARAAGDARQDQAAVHRTTEAIAQTLKDLGTAPAAAATTLGGATQDMTLAEGHLGSGSPAAASPVQGQAADEMQKARDQLEKERQKILDELARQVRKQVVENLTEMLDRQKSVRGATAALARTPSGPTVAAAAVRLASAESAIVRINQATLELIDETQFSVALPPALREVGRNCSSIADRLAVGTADGRVVADEQAVEQDLADLLDTFKQLSSDPGPSKCRGCKGNKNKLLAELKVLRLMQSHVNRRTAAADADRGAAADGRVADLAASQAETHAAAEAIHRELTGG